MIYNGLYSDYEISNWNSNSNSNLLGMPDDKAKPR